MSGETDLSGLFAAIYLRKSRADGETDVDTVLRRHRETLTAYAAEKKMVIAETFAEIRSGESLYSRPEMLRLLEAVETGKYGAVLCMDLDRLSRGGTRDRGLIWETFKDSGTLIVTPSKVYDLSQESDEMLVEFGGLIANMELRQIKKRMYRGRMKSLEDGGYIVQAPYGYRNCYMGKTPTLEIHEPEARFVRLMFGYAAEGTGGGMIAREINAMGARTRTGGKFERMGINRILRNPVYIGKVPWDREKSYKERGKKRSRQQPRGKWIIHDGVHPPIIEQDLFDRVQEVLDTRSTPPAKKGELVNPLAGLLRCEKCGRLIRRVLSRGHIPYSYCPNVDCDCAMAKMEYVESFFIAALEMILAEMEQSPGEPDTRRADELEAAKTALADETRKKARLYDLVEAGAYSPAEFRERMDAAKARIAALEVRIEELQKVPDRDGQMRDIRNALELYQTTDAPTQNQLLKKVVKVAWYSKEKGTKPAEFNLRVELKD